MLEPEPKERLSIDDILNSEWMKTYAQAPKTKLTTISNLKVNNENWDDFRENFGIELKECSFESISINQRCAAGAHSIWIFELNALRRR